MNCNIISPSLFAVPLWGHHRSPKKHHFFDQIVSQRSEGGILIQKKRTFLPKVSKRLVNALPESLRSYIWFQQTQTVAISFGFRWSTAVWFGVLKKRMPSSYKSRRTQSTYAGGASSWRSVVWDWTLKCSASEIPSNLEKNKNNILLQKISLDGDTLVPSKGTI